MTFLKVSDSTFKYSNRITEIIMKPLNLNECVIKRFTVS